MRYDPTTLRPSRPGTEPRRLFWLRARSARWTIRSTRALERSACGRFFQNPDEKLFPNQFVNINLKLSTLRAATVVPAAAIQRASFGTFVYVIKPDGKATIRKVTLGVTEGERVAVTEGVAPGERIVLEGVDALQEGVTVEIVGTGPVPEPSTEIPAPAGRGRGRP